MPTPDQLAGRPPAHVQIENPFAKEFDKVPVSVVTNIEEPVETQPRYTINDDTMMRARAAIIMTHCYGIITSVIADEEAAERDGTSPPDVPSRVFLAHAPDAVVGPTGAVLLFPGVKNSPIGKARGDTASYDLEEVMIWIGRTWPDIVEQIAMGVSEGDD